MNLNSHRSRRDNYTDCSEYAETVCTTTENEYMFKITILNHLKSRVELPSDDEVYVEFD
jgi:hypothetical protein